MFPISCRSRSILFLDYMLIMNISLAVFNLLPFPPLDGSKVLETFLPASMQPLLEMLEQYGFMILMVLMYMGFFSAIISPILRFVVSLFLLASSMTQTNLQRRATNRQRASRKLPGRAAQLGRVATRVRKLLLYRQPARDHAAAGSEAACRENERPGADLSGGRNRSASLDCLHSVRRSQSMRN